MSDWLKQHHTEALRRRTLQLLFNLAAVQTEIALLKARLSVVQAEKVLARHRRRDQVGRMLVVPTDIVEVDAACTAGPVLDLVAMEARDPGPAGLRG